MTTRNCKTVLLTLVGIGFFGGMLRPATATESAIAPRYAVEPMCPRTGVKRYCKALARLDSSGKRFFASTPQGFGAPDLAKAYNLDTSLTPGATIGIVDAYGYPNADKDLQAYRKQYNLPACTVANKCLTIVNQEGMTSPLPAANTGWEGETALDLDMASAACPNCKILLVQADDENGDGLMLGQAVAAKLGATVISNSWGGPESASQTGESQESYFMLSTKTTIFVAAGDDGYDNGALGDGQDGSDYPSTSAYVVGVGGTTLTQDSSTRGWSETVWNGGGSSCGISVPIPSWQKGVNTTCTFRAAADISAVGDPQTGVAVYQGGWQVVGGTSVASPLAAGIFALTGNGFAGPSWVYQNKSIWNDVTSGSNDQGVTGTYGCPSATSVLCNAGTGWDGPSGWGTPNGAAMVKAAGNVTPPDMATPRDMTTLADLAQPPVVPDDLALPVTVDAAAPGGGVGGNGNNGGNGNPTGVTGTNTSGCGCTLGGAPVHDTVGSIAIGGLFLGFLLLLLRRRRA